MSFELLMKDGALHVYDGNGLVPFTEFPGIDVVRTVPAGKGEQEILAAQEWLKARTPIGQIALTPGGQYTITDTLLVDAQRVSLNGNGSILQSSAFSTQGKPILHLMNGRSIDDKFVGMRTFQNLKIKGSDEGRNGNEVGIYIDSPTTALGGMDGTSVRAMLMGVAISGCYKGLSLKSQAYFTRMYGVEIYRNKFGIVQEAGAADFAENVVMFGGTVFNCDCLVQTLTSQIMRFFGTSFDYFGDNTGTRLTADDRAFDIQAGGNITLRDCHIEFNYGQFTGQTNAPIRLIGANSRFKMFGGRLGNFGNQNPKWSHLISTNNNTQVVSVEDVEFDRFGRVGEVLTDDALVGGDPTAVPFGTGSVAQVNTRNLRVANTTSKDDIPAIPCIQGNMRNGVDDPYAELIHRVALTGTATFTSVTGVENGVAARNTDASTQAAAKMAKITGDGTVIISFPVDAEWNRRHPWQLFLNASAVTNGTITVRERLSTFVDKWTGSAASTGVDARAAYAGTTYTFADRTNNWNRVNWKNVYPDSQLSTRRTGGIFTVEIATSGLVGALYLDDPAFQLM